MSYRCSIPNTTISSAKSEARTLPFDVTLKLFAGMDLTLDAVAGAISFNGSPSPQKEEQKSDAELKRERLIRVIKRLDEWELDSVIEYVDFIRSKSK